MTTHNASVTRWVKNYRAWLIRLLRWLFREPWEVWIAAGVGAYLVMLGTVRSSTFEAGLRIAGMFLQLAGIGTVAYGIHKTRKLFRRPGLSDSICEWWGRRPKLKQHVVLSAEPITCKVTCSGDLQVSWGISPSESSSLEERVIALEKQMVRVRQELETARKHLSNESRKREAGDNTECKQRQVADEEIRKLLEETAAGGLHLETMGVVWLIVGVFLSTAAGEIARFFTFA